jgi:hypothetical protein
MRQSPFPKEVWGLILSDFFGLQRDDLKAVSLVCCELREIAQPLLFTVATFKLGIYHTHREHTFAANFDPITPISWYPYTESSNEVRKLLEFLEFITSPYMASFVRICRLIYKFGSPLEGELQILDPRPQEQVIAALPKLTGLQHLRFLNLPIMGRHLQQLSYISLCDTKITFQGCFLIEPEGNVPPITIQTLEYHHLEHQILPSIRRASLLNTFLTQKIVRLELYGPILDLEELLRSCGPLHSIQSLSLSSSSLKTVTPHLPYFRNIRFLDMIADRKIPLISTGYDIPPNALPRLETLVCPFNLLHNFTSSPIRTLTTSVVLFAHRGPVSAEEVNTLLQLEPLLSELTSLTLLFSLTHDSVLEELLIHCHNLISLFIRYRRPTIHEFEVTDVTQLRKGTEVWHFDPQIVIA